MSFARGTIGFSILAALLISGAVLAKEPPLRTFATDGCTGYPNGTREKPNLWRHCCVEHDLSFWSGGETAGRPRADRRLRKCVAETGEKREAQIIYWGVRLGSLSPIKIYGMQWGNAWSKWVTRKNPLTHAEIDRLEAEIFRPVYDTVLPTDLRRDYILRLRRDVHE